MKSNIFLPEKINVGFQQRGDTYTGSLAYIIYFDEKGKLRKETSWNSWRDSAIENIIHENVPTEGFVLNKKVGGHNYGWNNRQTYVRVYDPRGFEFEIDIVNLLYILENTSSIKGKGLEGEFVYGWDGKELILIPVGSPDYKEISEYNEKLQGGNKPKAKDLKLGGTYLTKSNEEYIYLGRFDAWNYDYTNRFIDDKNEAQYIWNNNGKHRYFRKKDSESFIVEKSMSKFIDTVSEECVENYAELMTDLESTATYSPIDHSKTEYIPYTAQELEDKYSDSNNYGYGYMYVADARIRIEKDKEGIYSYTFVNPKYKNDWRSRNDEPYHITYKFKDAEEVIKEIAPAYKKMYLANGKEYSGGWY